MTTIRGNTPRGFVTVSEAAATVGVSERSLVRWCEAGDVAGATRQEWAGRYGYRWLVPNAWIRARARRNGRGAS